MANRQEDDIQVLASTALSRRYEEQLFNQAASHNRVVPAVVVTGFLGAGKTTLLQHLLAACGGQLKLGVLVNEVASVDVDSQLLHTAQSNAAAGIKATRLAGGCACCAVSSDLDAALAELAGSSSYQQLDCLLLETSGVADAEPLAASLAMAGFRLTAVVVVVDAEAGEAALQQEVAVAQVCAADIVVLNKCDLATLSGVATVEDRVQHLAPGVRMLRARFGQVAPAAVLDIEGPDDTSGQAADNSSNQLQQPIVHGEVAFLSHEPVVSVAKIMVRKQSSVVVQRRRTSVAEATARSSADPHRQHTQRQQQLGHRIDHSHFVTASFLSDVPLCMACFQEFTASTLKTATGLFRAKGFVWFSQQRSQRFVFHLSGKQRVECGSEGAWLGPPGVQLVLIGQHAHQLQQLQQALAACVMGTCTCSSTGNQPSGSTTCPSQQQQQQQYLTLQGQQQLQQRSDHVLEHERALTDLVCLHKSSAADRLTELVQQHYRFEIAQQQQQQQKQHTDDAGASGLVRFTAVGSTLHGVVADEVNASLLRRVNAIPGMFLFHVKSEAALHAVPGQQATYQGVKCLHTCFKSTAQPEEAEQFWQFFQDTVTGVLRKAYQHVHTCKCDAVGLQMMSATK